MAESVDSPGDTEMASAPDQASKASRNPGQTTAQSARDPDSPGQSADTDAASQGATAWSPGLTSSIPTGLLPLVTLYRPEHAFRSYAECRELAEFTGMKALDLVCLRPERLVTHELLVRVTADLSVADGPDYEVLGLNLRGMVSDIFERHVESDMPAIVQAFETERKRASEFIDRELDARLYTPAAPAADPPAEESFWSRLLGGLRGRDDSGGRAAEPPTVDEKPELQALEHWKGQLAARDESLGESLERHCLEALVKTTGTIIGNRGRLIVERDVLTRLASDQACRLFGPGLISRLVAPLFDRAVAAEGYRYLPAQENPVILNVKGASASGKSTIRPQQRQLAEKLGIPWSDFALISPDYWRKTLLDYESLGEHYRYGAMLTGQELEVIDRKMDRYMADKASQGRMSHLLIDRFRFDSFTLEKGRSADSRLLTRFGDRIYLFFMITPPAETVERAWKRGLSTGRYKAVDDLLYHNIEAYNGIPSLFLSWITSDEKQIHVEFLDNDVPEGQLPKTAAFGCNDSLTILDIELMINIDRYRKVNVSAGQADEIFRADELEPADNLDFIRRCVDTLADIRFADPASAELHAWIRNGELVWWNQDPSAAQTDTHGAVQTALQLLGYDCDAAGSDTAADLPVIDVAAERQLTVGHWGRDAAAATAPGISY